MGLAAEDDWRLDTSGVADEEWRDFQVLAFNLANIAGLVEQFQYAVDLLEHSTRQRRHGLPDAPPTHWGVMAGAHAALTIYHFRSSLEAIVSRVGACRSIVAKVDTKALEDIRQDFRKQFPHAKNMRDAVGHSADRIFRPELIDEHSFASGGIIPGQIFRGAFIISHKKDVLELPMDGRTTEQLRELKLRVYEALGKLLSRPPKDQTSRPQRTTRPRARQKKPQDRSAGVAREGPQR